MFCLTGGVLPHACKFFIKKEALAQVFSCEFCEILRTPVFTEHFWTTASVGLNYQYFLVTKLIFL